MYIDPATDPVNGSSQFGNVVIQPEALGCSWRECGQWDRATHEHSWWWHTSCPHIII